MKKILKLIAAILVCEGAGIIGSVFTIQSIPTWYVALNKPSFSPPNWVFGPVWTILYLMMGISLYLVWEKGFKTKKSRVALGAFATQLALNTLWSIVFFGMKELGVAFGVIIAMWAAILLTIIKFYPTSRKAAWMLVPYLAWVSFATLLNFSVWQLNV